MENLYAILLGGKIRLSNLMEDHQLVFVVASNEKTARDRAKQKWPEAESIHIDGSQKISQIDGYQIILKKSNDSIDKMVIDNEYSK